jgi:hypothetical protein
MKELNKLAVCVVAVFLIHRPERSFAAGSLPPTGRAILKKIKIGCEAVGSCAVRASGDLELQDSQFHSDLKHGSAVSCAHLASQDLVGLWIIGPTLDYIIQVPSHQSPQIAEG